MGTFHCARFPDGTAHIRTTAGTLVEFRDGHADVEDDELAAALLDVPKVFGISRTDIDPPGPQAERPASPVLDPAERSSPDGTPVVEFGTPSQADVDEQTAQGDPSVADGELAPVGELPPITSRSTKPELVEHAAQAGMPRQEAEAATRPQLIRWLQHRPAAGDTTPDDGDTTPDDGGGTDDE